MVFASVKNTLIIQGRLLRADQPSDLSRRAWLELYEVHREKIEDLDEGTQKEMILGLAAEFSAAEIPTAACF